MAGGVNGIGVILIGVADQKMAMRAFTDGKPRVPEDLDVN